MVGAHIFRCLRILIIGKWLEEAIFEVFVDDLTVAKQAIGAGLVNILEPSWRKLDSDIENCNE